MFLPEELERLKAILPRLEKELTTDAILLRWSEHDRLLDTLAATMRKHDVLNAATAMTLLLDEVEKCPQQD